MSAPRWDRPRGQLQGRPWDSFRDVTGTAELQLGILGVSEQGPAQRVHPGFVWL